MDNFDEVMKRNGFDIVETKTLFYETCKQLGVNPDEAINKAVVFILNAVGIIYKTNWDCVKERIAHVNANETNANNLFLINSGLLLAWQKIEIEGLQKASNAIFPDLN